MLERIGYGALWLLGYCAFALLWLHELESGGRTFLTGNDGVDQTYYWLLKNFTAFRSGEIPLWDFAQFSGATHAGELQPGVFYPPAWIYAWLIPSVDQLWIERYIALHFALCAFLTHGLLRRCGLPWPAVLVGALLASFCGSTALRAAAQANLYFGLCWLPLFLRLAIRAMERRPLSDGLVTVVLAGTVLAISLLAGHVHQVILAGIAAGIAALLPPTERPTLALQWRLLVCAAMALWAMVCALAQLQLTTEYLALAYKWYGDGFTAAPHRLPLSSYAGLSVPPSAWWSIIGIHRGSGIADGGTLSLGLTGLALALLALLTQFRLRLVGFALLMLISSLIIASAAHAPYGEHLFQLPVLNQLRSPSRALHLYALAAAMLAAVGLAWLWRGGLALKVLAVFAVTGVLYEAALFRPRLTQPSDVANAIAYRWFDEPVLDQIDALDDASPQPYRYVLRAGSANQAKTAGASRGLRAIGGYRSSMPAAYYDYLTHRPEAIDALGARYLIDAVDPSESAPDALKLSISTTAEPIFSLRLADGGWAELPIKLVAQTHNRIELELHAPITGRVRFAQLRYPDWHVEIDGRRAEWTADDVFYGVELERATHLRFWYWPERVVPGLWLWVLAMLAAPALALRLCYVDSASAIAETSSTPVGN